jgi:hypothetical protein
MFLVDRALVTFRPISDIICVTYQLDLGVEMMGVMITQQLLPLAPEGAVLIGDAAALVTDDDGGRVFIRGELCFVWDAGDDLGRRLAAVQLAGVVRGRLSSARCLR